MKKILLTLVVAVLGISSAAIAHHSTNLGYISDIQDFELTGEFVSFLWVNPHVLMTLNVTNEEGEVEEWTAETHGASVLGRFGWRPNMFAPGQELTIIGNPPRQPDDNIIHILRVQTEDGKTYNVNRAN